MTPDLINRLRVAAAWAWQDNEPDNGAMLDEAADEIERLQSALSEIAETPGRRWQRKIARQAIVAKERR